ncbi:MAG: 50S ribosomal protein L21 [Actinobacteria bacterium]|nr:50S ribosomal protein L21 [Actinomycetota bacterium]
MYAVIRAGGKQHKVKAGDVIEVELMHGGGPGDTVTFDPILVVDDDGTTRFGKDASRSAVTAELLGERKGDKVKVFKYRPKSGYARRQGHRQMMTLVEIKEIAERPAQKKAALAKAPKAEKAEGAEAPAKGAKAEKPAGAEEKAE